MHKKAYYLWKLVVYLMCISIIITLPQNVSAESSLNDVDSNGITYVEVLWKETADSFESLFELAQLIIVGTVSDQWSEKSGNLVFTISEVVIDKVIKGNVIDNEILVNQIGGDFYSISFPCPEGMIRLENGNSYVLFLNGSNNEFVVAGAAQGIFYLENTIREDDSILLSCKRQFENRYSFHRILETPVNGYQFPYSYGTAYYYIELYSDASYTTSNINSLRAGIESWNNLSGISIVNTSSAAWAQIVIHVRDSFALSGSAAIGSDIWAITYADSIYSKNIEISTSSFDTSYSVNWQKIGCHETGHALGLAHNSLSSSVMNPYISLMTLYPDEADVITLRQLYGYPW